MTVRHAVVRDSFIPNSQGALKRMCAAITTHRVVRWLVQWACAEVLAAVIARLCLFRTTADSACARARGAASVSCCLGRSHRHAFRGASIWATGGYESPRAFCRWT